MNSRLRDILLRHEETPPAGNWEKISRELDDAAAGFRFPQALYDLSVTPASMNWHKISQALDEEAIHGSVAEKLYQVEIPAPVSSWEQISMALDAPPAIRRPAAWLRYTAAALLIGILSFSAFKIFRQPATSTPSLAGIAVPESLSHEPENTVPVPAAENGSGDLTHEDQEARNDAALEASKHSYARLEFNPSQKAVIAAAFRFDENSPAAIEEPAEKTGTADKPGERYVLLMNPDGHFIRMSKKLSNLLCCVSGEEQDKECRSMVDNWRKQLACSDAAHPGNFMDILNLVSSLQEQ